MMSNKSFYLHDKITKKLLRDRDERVPPLSQYQERLLKQTKSLEDLIQSVEWNNDDLRYGIDETEFALEDLEKQRKPGTKHIIPGEKINQTLK